MDATNPNSLVELAREDEWDEVVRVFATLGPAPSSVVNVAHTGDGTSLLHWAVSRRREDVLPWLLGAGADPNLRDARGRSPLWLATMSGPAHVLRTLIAAGGDVNSRGGGGSTGDGHCVMSDPSPDHVARDAVVGLTLPMQLVRWGAGGGTAPQRLQVLLGCPELQLGVTVDGMGVEQWARAFYRHDLASMVVEEVGGATLCPLARSLL